MTVPVFDAITRSFRLPRGVLDAQPAVPVEHALAENLGFAPIKLGGLSEGGLLVHARGSRWGQLIFKDLIKIDG